MPVNSGRYRSVEGSSSNGSPGISDLAPGIFLENVSFAYSEKEIFRGLNFTVEGGLWTCLIGPSGCGKSTLLRIISGTLREGLTGSIRFGGFARQE